VRFFALDKLINLHDGYARQFKIDSRHFLLVQHQGEPYLMEAHCPHRGHALLAASIADGVITCPLHAYRFALADGRLLRSTEEPCRALRVFDVVYLGTEVGVMLDG